MKYPGIFHGNTAVPKLLITIMRTTTLAVILICTTAMLLSARESAAQDVNEVYIQISAKNESLEKVIRQIEKKSVFKFVIDASLAKNSTGISLSEKNSSVGNILQQILSPFNLSFEQDGKNILILKKQKNILSLQEGTVTGMVMPPAKPVIVIQGRITNEKGDVLPGVSIQEKGTSNMVVSNEAGKYSITVDNKNAVLVFTYIGLGTQEIKVNDNTVIDLVLKPEVAALNDIVVVGYGTQKKTDLTGAVSTVKGTALTKASMPNLANSFAGKLTGVISTQQSGKPGFDDPKFFVRGKSTFGDNSALILVDGIERPAGRVDPNEIESVTLLKDAASTAVYGARAANGVILITTKRGVEGSPVISYTTSFGVQKAARKPALMNAYEYATYLNMGLASMGNLPRFSDAEIAQYKTGTLPSTDWWNESLNNTAPIQQHDLNITGGTKTIKYFISLGYLNQEGLYDLSFFKRYNVRSNLDVKVTSNLRISLDLSGRMEKTNQSALGDAVFSFAINAKPTERPYTPDNIAVGGLGSSGFTSSPIGQALYAGYNKTTANIFQGTIQAVYDITAIKGLSAKVNYSFDPSASRNKVFSTPYTFYVYDKVNDSYTEMKSASKITLSQLNAASSLQTLQASLNYDRKFGKHSIAGLLLFEQAEGNTSAMQTYREGFLSSTIDEIFAGAALNQGNDGTGTETARRGYVGRVNYSYADKYLLQANFRYDGSFNFPGNKRWGLFPAFSAGWRISKETFMNDQPLFSNLKLRASYGRVGNDRVPQFQYLSGFVFSNGAVIGNTYPTAINDNGIANPTITWETAGNTDIGIEFGILKEKITGEIDYFQKRTRNILLPRNASVPASFGASLPYENIGVVDNKGIEAVIRYRDNIGKVFLSVEGNLTYAKSKVIFMDEPADVEDRIKRTGRPLDQYFGYAAVGLFQTQAEIDQWADQDGNSNQSILTGDIKYLDYNKDGKIDGFDVHYLGQSDVPQIIYGVNLSARWKGLDITANLQGAGDFKQYFRWDPFNLESNALRIFSDSWTEQNTDARFPRLYTGLKQNNRLTSSYWLFNGSYLKLRNVELAYTLQNNLLKKAGINSLRLFVSGNNLITFSKFRDFDPEAPSIAPGSNNFYYPQLKTYNAGLNVEF